MDRWNLYGYRSIYLSLSLSSLLYVGENIEFGLYPVALIAELLKLYLSELPEPLLTYELYDLFIDSAGNIILYFFPIL